MKAKDGSQGAIGRVARAAQPVMIAGGSFVVAFLWLLAFRNITKALDLSGVFFFAYAASCVAWKTVSVRNNIVRVGLVTVAALVTGCGGGALLKNPLLYGDLVPYPFEQPEYLAVVAAAVFLSALDLQARIARHDAVAAAADAIAHALFTLSGAEIAIERFGPGGIGVIGAIFAAFASAAGGGIIRDLILDQIAGRFRGIFPMLCSPYRWSSLFGAVVVVALLLTAPANAWAGAALSGILVYVGRDLKLTKPDRSPVDDSA